MCLELCSWGASLPASFGESVAGSFGFGAAGPFEARCFEQKQESGVFGRSAFRIQLESLILAQNERWRRALYMQVERESGFGREYSGARVSNTWVIYLEVGNNSGKLGLIPHIFS